MTIFGYSLNPPPTYNATYIYYSGHISMLPGVKLWRCVKVGIFLVVDGWNDEECYDFKVTQMKVKLQGYFIHRNHASIKVTSIKRK